VEEDPILIDLSIKSKTYGKLFYYCPSITYSSKPVPIYDSLKTWIKTVIECYKTNVYTVTKDGILIINDNEREIVKKYNEDFTFWNS
jgi:hypothetical protein